MIGQKWLLLILINIFLLSPIVSGEETGGEFEETDEVVNNEKEEKEKFVPIQFVPPKLGENSVAPNFFDYFDATSKIDQIWIKSQAKKDDVDSEIAKYNGEWDIGSPSKVSIEGDAGLIVKTKARHHAIAAKLTKPFKFDADKLVVQYDVKFEEGQECGGGYLKLLSAGAETNLANFQDKTPYTIMFGPDKCGATGKVHLIFRYRNPINGSIDEYHANQPKSVGTAYWDDHKTHLYTLVFKKSGDFSVNVDGKNLFYGNVLNDVTPSLTPPKQIFDPEDLKPADWDDRAEIEDLKATKPDDWDENEPKEVVDETAVKPSDWNEDETELIPDPEAKKPSDWDDEMDGEWEPPMIDNPMCKEISGCGKWKQPTIINPKYKGKWVRPKVANPAYKGVWSPRLVENPNYFEPKPFSNLASITAVGIELWTMSENIIFDNILITSSEEDASDIARQTFSIKHSEENRLEEANGNGGGFLKGIIDAANEKPWLWAVYILCVLLPLVFLGVFCFGRQSKPTPAVQTGFGKKNNDTYTLDDDKVPNLVDENGEEVAEEEEQEEDEEENLNEPGPSNSKSEESVENQPEGEEEKDEDDLVEVNPSKSSSARSSSVENDVEHILKENEPVVPTEEVAKKSPKTIGGAKRRVARRGD